MRQNRRLLPRYRCGTITALCLVACLTFQRCASSGRVNFIPKNVSVDSTGPHYLHNISEIKYWDRMSMANRATNFAWIDSSGQTHEMNEYYNKVVVLNFFSPSAPASVAELRSIDSTRVLGDTNVLWLVVGMNVGTGGKAIRSLDTFATQNHVTEEVLAGIPDFGFTYGGIDVVPTTFVITLRRKISDTFDGLVPEDTLRSAIQRAEQTE